VIGTLTIDPRHSGPVGSANGGIACGAVARFLDGPAQVSLRAPVPLGEALDVDARDDGVVVTREGALIAEGRPAGPVEAEPPLRPTLAEAREAMRSHPWLDEERAVWDCWVCGAHRHDGLGLSFGRHPREPEVTSALLVADATVPHDGEVVTRDVMWGALDCPSYAPHLWDADRPSLLARLHAELLGDVRLGEPVVAVGWALGSEGRKHHTASALLSADGELLGRARALWITPRS
jgi:hypothetical protein